jgi:hypothetical protein
MAQPGTSNAPDTTYLDDTVVAVLSGDPNNVPGLDQLAYAVGVGAMAANQNTGDPDQDEINATRLRVAAFLFSRQADMSHVLKELGHLVQLEGSSSTPPAAQTPNGGLGGLLGGTPPPMAGQQPPAQPAPSAATQSGAAQPAPSAPRTGKPGKPRPGRPGGPRTY